MSLKAVFQSGEPTLRLGASQLCNSATLPDGDVLLQTTDQVCRVSPEGEVRWRASGSPFTGDLVGPGGEVVRGRRHRVRLAPAVGERDVRVGGVSLKVK